MACRRFWNVVVELPQFISIQHEWLIFTHTAWSNSLASLYHYKLIAFNQAITRYGRVSCPTIAARCIDCTNAHRFRTRKFCTLQNCFRGWKKSEWTLAAVAPEWTRRGCRSGGTGVGHIDSIVAPNRRIATEGLSNKFVNCLAILKILRNHYNMQSFFKSALTSHFASKC